MPRLIPEDELAPHGRDDDGEPKAPYGYLVNGRPRKGNRGARPKSQGSAAAKPGVTTPNQTDQERKQTLIMLTQMFFVNGLVGLSVAPFVKSLIGEEHADALAGDAVIVDHFAAPFADGMIALAQYKPSALSWLDKVEDKAPYLLLTQVGVNLGKALMGHHRSPDKRLNAAGRTLIELRSREMAFQVEQQMAEFEQMEQQQQDQAA